MALKATIHKVELAVSDMDRGYYATHALTLARHPSETSERLMVLSVGTVGLEGMPQRGWLPGALADHLTSLGGDLLGGHNQGKAWQWIRAGATASHGTVSEPCNHLHKFPHPLWLMGHYAQGSTAIEAYWKSVAWPQQSLFIGEPLAAPFARRPEPEAASLSSGR